MIPASIDAANGPNVPPVDFVSPIDAIVATPITITVRHLPAHNATKAPVLEAGDSATIRCASVSIDLISLFAVSRMSSAAAAGSFCALRYAATSELSWDFASAIASWNVRASFVSSPLPALSNAV